MKHFAEVLAAYADANDRTLAGIEAALGAGRDELVTALERRKRVNDQAFFLLLFARFEDVVNLLADTLIRAGKRSDDPGLRRLWRTLDDRNRNAIINMPFLDRLGLLLDKGDADFAEIKELYRQRNLIAHGGFPLEEIDVNESATILDRIASLLQDAP